VDAPVDEVFGFHEREDALDLLSPSFPPVRKVSATGGIRVGALVELRVGTIRWVARHTKYERNHLFIDEQIEGPFRSWVHRHEFDTSGKQTRLTDRVEYRLRGGPVVNAAFGWVVKAGLWRMFSHRHRVTRKICESHGAPAAGS
jgi:ligand-binding SRPBCC domain-containing protein